MSLPWSAEQREWLREMGFDVLTRRSADAQVRSVSTAATPPAAAAPTRAQAGGAAVDPRLPAALQRVAQGVDLAPLLAGGPPRDVAARRALWRALRPLRKAARAR